MRLPEARVAESAPSAIRCTFIFHQSRSDLRLWATPLIRAPGAQTRGPTRWFHPAGYQLRLSIAAVLVGGGPLCASRKSSDSLTPTLSLGSIVWGPFKFSVVLSGVLLITGDSIATNLWLSVNYLKANGMKKNVANQHCASSDNFCFLG